MIGETAPNFILKDQHNKDWEFYKNLDRFVLLVFYPKDDTLVCTKQLKNYNDNLDSFNRVNIKLVGINTGTVSSHNSFCNNLGLRFPLLSDLHKSVSRTFKATNIFGINIRKLVLVNPDKIVTYEKKAFNLTFYNADEIIRSLKQLNIIKLT